MMMSWSHLPPREAEIIREYERVMPVYLCEMCEGYTTIYIFGQELDGLFTCVYCRARLRFTYHRMLVHTECHVDTVENAAQLFRNSTTVIYACYKHYFLASGNLMRRCNNGTWSGSHPECVVNSVLPKQWLVLLIVGVTVALFALVIPYDFHKFRKRKRECREKQQHVNLMVRIQPFHAKNMGAQSSFSEDESEPTRRSFGIGSILAFFRLVKKKRNQKKNPPPETPSDAVNNISSTTPTNPGPVLQNQIPTVSLHHEQLPVIKPVPPIVPKTRTKSDEDHPCRKKDDIPHRLPRAKSLGNGIGRTVSVAVGPRSATFPNAKTNRGFENNGDISPRVSGDVSPNLSQDALRRIPEHLASCQDHASVMEPSGEVFPEELPPSKETSPKSVETSPVLSEDFAAEQYPSTAGHLSLVDELMDERGSDYGGRKRSQTSHPAAPAPRSLSLNMNRYKAKKSPPSRSKSSSSRPYVGSSPSHMMDMGF